MPARPALIVLLVLLAGGAACGTKVVDFGPPEPDASVGVSPKCFTETPSGPAGANSVRCLVCGGMQGTCLLCKATGDPGNCSLCFWDDNPELQCKRCPGANGMIVDDCNELRPELLPPDKISNGAGSGGLTGQAPQ